MIRQDRDRALQARRVDEQVEIDELAQGQSPYAASGNRGLCGRTTGILAAANVLVGAISSQVRLGLKLH